MGLQPVRYRLSADGLTLTAEERFRGREMSYDNVWVLDRSVLQQEDLTS